MRTVVLAVFLGVALTLGGIDTATGQQALTLPEAVMRAKTQGPAAELARLSFAQARWSYRGLQAQYLPSLALTGNVPGLQRGIAEIQQDDGSVRFVQQNSTSSSVGLSVSQVFPMTGSEISVTSGLSRLTNEFGDFEQNEWRTTPLIVGLRQPLFRFNEWKWLRRTEPLRYEVSQRDYAEALEDVAVETTDRFFDAYLAFVNAEIAVNNVAVNDSIYTLSQGRFDIGKIAENDLLQSELALLNAQSDRSDAEIAYQQALQDLKLYLEVPPATDLALVPPTELPPVSLNPEDAVAHARRYRALPLDLELQALEAERELARARRSSGFSADVTASYGLNQSASSFDGAYSDPLDQQAFSVGFQVPLWRWGRGQAGVEAATAVRDRVEEQADLRQLELEQEVYFEALRLRQLRQQVEIAEKADEVADRRFEVAKNRYLIGTSDITELFNAQREKDQARRSYIQTLRQFWTAYYRLRRLTLVDVATGQPLASPGG